MKIRLHTCLLIIGSALLCGSAAVAKSDSPLVPLKLYFNAQTGDHFTLASAAGESDAKERGYDSAGIDGHVFSSPYRGTVPLKLYWNVERRDYMLVATLQGENDAKGANYEFVGNEGYIFPNPEPGTIPLKLYWKGADNFTFTGKANERSAITQEYHFVRTEGYVVQNPRVFLLDQPIDYVPLLAKERGLSEKAILLNDGERLITPLGFKPPVEVTVVAKTDSTNLRIGYAADQVIFNWELDPHQLRIDGGPANGRHVAERGLIPTDKFVTIRWIVTSREQAILVDDRLRFYHAGDYSDLEQPVSVFPAAHSRVTVKSLTVKRLAEDFTFDVEKAGGAGK